jgi:FkbM family methyltransferase
MTRWTSYAQNGEDVVLARVLADVDAGFWIDVGAQDPRMDSVTCAFAERGWRGINIEPVPHWHAALVAARPRDLNLAVAAGEAEARLPFFEVADSGLSTLDPRLAGEYRDAGHAVREHAVQVRTLAAICAEHVRGAVHFLKIDAEGAEGAVLRGMDFDAVRPWVVLVEATEPNSRVPTQAAWEPILRAARYAFAYGDGINRFYLAEEHAALADRFGPPTVLDHSVRREQVDEVALVSGRLAEVQAELQRHAALVAAGDEALAASDARRQADAQASHEAHAAARARESGLVEELDRMHRAAADLRLALERGQAALAHAEATLARAEDALAQSEAARAATDAALARSHGALAEAQAECSRAQARADAAETARAVIATRLRTTEHDLAQLASRVPDLQAQVRAAAAAHATAHAELLRHVGLIDGLRAEHAQVLASRSWRLTAPLRAVNRFAARVRGRLAREARARGLLTEAPAAALPADPPLPLTEDAARILADAPVDRRGTG